MTDERGSIETKGEPVRKGSEVSKEPLTDEKLAAIAAGLERADALRYREAMDVSSAHPGDGHLPPK